MFEKDAEKHCNETFCSVCENPTCTEHVKCREWRDRRAGFYCGAEFGYNKANEWHYVKDGINPTHSYRVLVFTDEGVGFGIYGLDDKKWHTYDTGFEVIAWKEIVLPELKESK